MKIDKIVFSATEKYSPFWNYQSKVWNKLGVTPVLLLWGEVKNTTVDDTYGEVIEKKYSDDAIKSLQMTWSKFYHTSTEPETTWLIGDIDLFPLQSNYFLSNLKDISNDSYAHLACRHQTRHEPPAYFDGKGSELTGGQNLPAYYHLAKGKIFDSVYKFTSTNFLEYVNTIVSQKVYGRGIPQEYMRLTPKQIASSMNSLGTNLGAKHSIEPFWCADESYSSTMLWNAIINKLVNFTGLNFSVANPNPYLWNRIDRCNWDGSDYSFVDLKRLRNNQYIDFHSVGPSESMDNIVASFDKIEHPLKQILSVAGML
jgi:hypothetical protein